MLMTDSPATAPAELLDFDSRDWPSRQAWRDALAEDLPAPEPPRTRRCGWCRASGLHLDTRGGLERHNAPGRGRCRGFETYRTEDTRGY